MISLASQGKLCSIHESWCSLVTNVRWSSSRLQRLVEIKVIMPLWRRQSLCHCEEGSHYATVQQAVLRKEVIMLLCSRRYWRKVIMPLCSRQYWRKKWLCHGAAGGIEERSDYATMQQAVLKKEVIIPLCSRRYWRKKWLCHCAAGGIEEISNYATVHNYSSNLLYMC